MKKRGGGRISRRLGVWGHVLTLTMMATQVIFAQDRGQGRSMVISRGGIVAAESPLEAQGGVGIFGRRGGKGGAAADWETQEKGGGAERRRKLRETHFVSG